MNLKQSVGILASIAMVAFWTGCGGGSSGAVAVTEAGDSGVEAVATDLTSFPTLDLSSIETQANANYAKKDVSLKGFGEVGSPSMMGCQLSNMKNQMFNMSGQFDGAMCFIKEVQANTTISFTENEWTYFQFSPFTGSEEVEQACEEIDDEGNCVPKEGWTGAGEGGGEGQGPGASALFGTFKMRVKLETPATGSRKITMDQCVGSQHMHRMVLTIADVTNDNNGALGVIDYAADDCTTSAYPTGCTTNPQYLSISGDGYENMSFDMGGSMKGHMTIASYIVKDTCACTANTSGTYHRTFTPISGTFAGKMSSFFGNGQMNLVVDTLTPLFKIAAGFTTDTTSLAEGGGEGFKQMSGSDSMVGTWNATKGCGQFSVDQTMPPDPSSGLCWSPPSNEGEMPQTSEPVNDMCAIAFEHTEGFAITTVGGTSTYAVSADETFCGADYLLTMPTTLTASDSDLAFDETWDCEPAAGQTFNELTDANTSAIGEACGGKFDGPQTDTMSNCMEDQMGEQQENWETIGTEFGGAGKTYSLTTQSGCTGAINFGGTTATLTFQEGAQGTPAKLNLTFPPPNNTYNLPLNFSENPEGYLIAGGSGLDFMVTINENADGMTLAAYAGADACTVTMTAQ